MAEQTEAEFCLQILVGENTITSRCMIDDDPDLKSQTLLQIARDLWANAASVSEVDEISLRVESEGQLVACLCKFELSDFAGVQKNCPD